MRGRWDGVAVAAAPGVFVMLWASGFIGAKLGLPYAEPMTFLTIRMVAVIALLIPLVLVTRPGWPSASGAVHQVVAGVLVHGLYLGGVFTAISHGLSAGVAALIVALQPVLTSTLANRLFGETVRVYQWAGLALGLGGVWLVVYPKIGHGDAAAPAWIAIVIALFGITIGTLYQKRFGGGVDWRPAFLIQYGAAALTFGTAATVFETRAIQWSVDFIVAVAWLVLVLSFGAVWLLYFLIRRSAATKVASLFYLVPPVTALMAWGLFGEQVSPMGLAGTVVCVAGVFLVNWQPRQ